LSIARRFGGPIAAFVLAIVAGAAFVLVSAAVASYKSRGALQTHSLTRDVWISEQLTADHVVEVQRQGFRSIIDLRPDGEAPDQLPSAEVERLARASGIGFAYVPVQHGDIPAETVDQLVASLRNAQRPVLLYCRTGRRAARTWALAEASRPDGLDAAAIDRAVARAGQSDDDLAAFIAARIAARPAP
jgi:uncharacterized protein (TIGR01244 family)